MSSKNHHLTDHKKTYIAVFIILLILTAITLKVAYHDYGVLNIVVAMGVATIKGSLVCLFFMHLKYDKRLNQVVFISAFVFLALFVGLTASDEWFRPVEIPAKVHAIEPPAGSEGTLMEKLRVATPEQIAKGKEIYAAQCGICHGPLGKGDGPAAASLTPKPRDFTSGTWTQGGTPVQVFITLTKGIDGTTMGSYASLPVHHRWAVVHYVRDLSPNKPEDTPQTLSLIGLGEGTTGKPKDEALPTLPIEFAIDRLVKESMNR